MSAFFMFLWHVSQQFPKEGQMQPVSSVLAKWLFSIPLLSPNLEDNSHLAGWSSESKYVSCFPNMEVSKISMISPKLCPLKSWVDLKRCQWSTSRRYFRSALCCYSQRLLFGGNSYIARTPGASRPAVPGCMKRWCWWKRRCSPRRGSRKELWPSCIRIELRLTNEVEHPFHGSYRCKRQLSGIHTVTFFDRW